MAHQPAPARPPGAVQCRTAALGGHRDRCDQCTQPGFSYNSCRDRHCPKCLTAARNQWVAAREQELLPVGYVHVVFTMPEVLARLALGNKRVVYDLLLKASAATLLQVAANPRRLGAAIGGLMVLHTWGQRLQHRPHIHHVVPAGGLAPDGARWIHARPRFFLPIPVLRQVFRGKLVAGLRERSRRSHLHQLCGVLQAPNRARTDVAGITFVRWDPRAPRMKYSLSQALRLGFCGSRRRASRLPSIPSALRGLDPRHRLPLIRRLSERLATFTTVRQAERSVKNARVR